MLNKNTLQEFFGETKPEIDYSKLNKEQYEAVTTTEGPVLIIAGAGSGKTTVLTYRLAHLIEKGILPEQILLLTFTNKAAKEMVERATNMIKTNHKIDGGTYHSFCAYILKVYGDRLGFNKDFIIKDSVDSADNLSFIKEQMGYSKEKKFPNGSELSAIFSIAVNKNKSIEWVLTNKYPKYLDYSKDIEEIKKMYTTYKHERNILDYDDLLIYTNKLLKEHPDIKKKISDNYKYIMVDEYQDSNRLQFELISLLRSENNKNICVVGDDQQCVIKGTLIPTKRGHVPVENITENDEILVSSGHGTVLYVKPEKIMQKQFIGDVYEIETYGGKKLTLTGDHTIFAYKKRFKPRETNTADFYMFDSPEPDEDGYYNHKMYLSDNHMFDRLKDIEDCDEAIDAVENLLKRKKYSYLNMEMYARILKECHHFFEKVENLKEGMFVCSYNFELEKILNDKIISITKKPYSGPVYDINVEFYRNYYANDICVHNCIYGFRGSNHKNILDFPKQFENCKTIILNKNYRSNQEILDLSNAVSNESKEKFDKELQGTHESSHKPELIFTESEYQEAQAILYDIIKNHREGMKFKDMAVLIRSSNDSSALEALIVKMTGSNYVPYKKFGGIKFMERSFVKDIFAYLKVIVNEKDEISWFRILQLYLNIGPAYAKKIVDGINREGIDYLLDDTHKKRVYGQCLPMIYEFYTNIQKKDFSEQIDDIINIHYYNARKLSIDNMKSGKSVINEYKRELDEDIENAQVLLEMAKTYKTASSFINDLTLEATTIEDNDDYLTISTVHSVKGLEFDTVYVMNCVNKKFPWIKKPLADTKEAILESEEEYEEERRVFYVAITRAKENLKLYVPNEICVYGHYEEAELSNFLTNNLKYCDIENIC